MKQLLIIFFIGFFAYSLSIKNNECLNEEHIKVKKKTVSKNSIGEKIHGDFNGDKLIESATSVKIIEGKGNPIEDGTADEFEIQFSNKNIKPINAGCCELILINEGDLNNDGIEDISIFKAPMNGCTYSLTTYSFIKGNWVTLVDEFLIPTGCDKLSNDELQNRIFKEKNNIYFYDIDVNDENGRLVKKKATKK